MLKGKENISTIQCILTIGLLKQATIASMADRKSKRGTSSSHQSTTSAGIQSDQDIGDLLGSRIDEAMLQVIKRMAFVDLRRRLEASIYIVCRTELSHEAILQDLEEVGVRV